MPTDNLNQSGATATADSAREESATAEQSTGPDTAAAEPSAAAESNDTAPSGDAALVASPEQPIDGEASGAQDFSAMLATYEKESAASRQEGEIVRGIVVGISDQNVLVDIGYKSEGVVARE